MLREGPEEELPVLCAPAEQNSLLEHRSCESEIVLGTKAADIIRIVSPHKFAHTRIVGLLIVDTLQNGSVAFYQLAGVHLWHVVQFGARAVSITRLQQAAFVQQPAVELRARQRLLQAHHPEGDRTFLDEANLAIKDIVFIEIESYDEAGHYLDAITLYVVYAVEHIALGVLKILGFLQAVFILRLNADKHADEPSVAHKP